MKIQALLLGAALAAMTSSAWAGEALLSPRAAGNQIRVAVDTSAPAITVAYVARPTAWLSPRAAGNQIKVVSGAVADTNPAAVCRATMNGTPKAVTECSSHANMPGCQTLAVLK
jgi:hypothetical protein